MELPALPVRIKSFRFKHRAGRDTKKQVCGYRECDDEGRMARLQAIRRKTQEKRILTLGEPVSKRLVWGQIKPPA